MSSSCPVCAKKLASPFGSLYVGRDCSSSQFGRSVRNSSNVGSRRAACCWLVCCWLACCWFACCWLACCWLACCWLACCWLACCWLACWVGCWVVIGVIAASHLSEELCRYGGEWKTGG